MANSNYAHIIFINSNRLDTTKKKLAVLSFADFAHCASVFMELWCFPSNTCEFDQKLPQTIRDIKGLLLNDKDALQEFRALTVDTILKSEGRVLSMQFRSSDIISKEKSIAQFRTFLRSILRIGTSLGNPKELKDVFINIVEKIVEPCISHNWMPEDIEAFFTGMSTSFSNMKSISSSHQSRNDASFNRLLTGLMQVSLCLYIRIKQKE
jgi:hypothetical protein